MLGKSFRSPLLVKKETTSSSDDPEPQAKKRRISEDNAKEQLGTQLVFKAPGISSLPRRPLLAVSNPASAAETSKPQTGGIEGYYNVLWSVS